MAMATTRPCESSESYRVGDDGVAAWSERHADAWIGLLETHKQLTRMLDAELESRFGLSLSGLELLARLAAAPDRCLRLSALAAQAVEAHPTPEGLALMRDAQCTHFASVQERFFEQLRPGELEVLADVFGRFSERAAASGTEPPRPSD